MGLSSRASARSAGFLLGAAVVVLLLAGWRVPGGRTAPGAEVSLTINRTGELDVEPHGRLLAVRRMVPERSAQARFVVTNTTGARLAVRLRGHAPDRGLDEQLAFRVTARRKLLFSGTLRELRMPTRARLVLARGARAPLVVWFRLLSSARAYRARSAEVSLELVSDALG